MTYNISEFCTVAILILFFSPSYLHAKSIIHRDLKSNSILSGQQAWNFLYHSTVDILILIGQNMINFL